MTKKAINVRNTVTVAYTLKKLCGQAISAVIFICLLAASGTTGCPSRNPKSFAALQL